MNNKLNYSYKKQKGVTLIALVITILVLLILAGVSITALVGEKGIVGQAKIAKHETNKAGLREEADLVLIDREGKERGEKNKLKEDLEAGISGNKTVKEVTNSKGEIYPDICIVTRDGATITVYEEGTIIDDEIDIWDGISKKEPQIDKEKNWHIYTTEELNFFKDFVNGKLSEEEKAGLEITPETTIYLENNLDFGARFKNGELIIGTAFEPIGKNGNYFDGIFDGKNHTISGIYMKEEEKASFITKSKKIENLTIANSYFEGTMGVAGITTLGNYITNCHNVNTDIVVKPDSTSPYADYAAGIVGNLVDGKIENCSNSGNVKVIGKNSSEISATGGIVGSIGTSTHEETIVKSCTNTGTIETDGKIVGGISGMNNMNTLILDCVNQGKIIGNHYNAGGISGANNEKIINCKNYGDIIGKSKNVGGISGDSLFNSEISSCINYGKVNGIENVGGIVGIFTSKTSKNINLGEVTGKIKVGGIAGAGVKAGKESISHSAIIESYNRGKIKGLEGGNLIGGIIGNLEKTDGKISNNYNAGTMEINQSTNNVGEIIGLNVSTNSYNNNYYNSDIIKINSSNNYPEQKNGARTTNQMKEDNFINELNEGLITEVWKKDTRLENDGYPIIIK